MLFRSNAFLEMYEWGADKRKHVGMRALEHAHKDYNLNKIVADWDASLTKLIENWKQERKAWEVKTL